MNMARRQGEDIRLFWVRFDKARIAVELTDTILPDTVLYSRAINSLKLNSTNKDVLLPGLEACGKTPSAKTLKDVSVKIFGSSSDDSSKIVLEAMDADEKMDSDSVGEETWLSKGKNKPQNRPSSNAASGRGSIRALNLANGYQSSGTGKGSKKPSMKGKSWCIRCGSVDYQWQQCPLPYQPQLAFGKSNGEPSDGKGKKKILLSEEIATTNNDDSGEVNDGEAFQAPSAAENLED